MRLQKYMAQCGIASRRASEAYIKEGRVKVNGHTVTQMGVIIDPSTDIVSVDGKRITPQTRHAYYAFYKPRGVTTTMKDDRGRKSVGDYFSNIQRRLFPVGRLDADSEGLLLMTDDGDFAQKATHPQYGVIKTYRCTLDAPYKKEKVDELLFGLDIGEKALAKAEEASFANRPDGRSILSIRLSQGMNRQIRRMLEVQGYQVLRLTRTAMGNYLMGDMKPGSFSRLREEEALRALQKPKCPLS
ncbi:rRNA pseudouridine synthase [Eubacteriales bacterium OttesenSCG-928-M02]|nr:rRNA pseudouridine synthase [Eubacteriales bacterium OttesenSCG-928-M02]